jgi:DNA helicase-2/ATP-dependent DNA helicase PcrA
MLLNMLQMKMLKIQITDNAIKYTKQILLPESISFDDQRKNFIKNLATIDLQSVPGSGKTTALLAKLLILEKHLPFQDGSGVLVISHTNAAVDEIKARIERYCPRLFSYPNFVGTIQSFVDQFLAIPFYTNLYKRKPYRIDDEIYNEKASNFSSMFFKGFTQQEQNNAKRFLRAKSLSKNLRFSPSSDGDVLTDGLFGKTLNYTKPRGNTKPQNYTDWSDQEKQRIEQWIQCFKNKFLEDGILCFDDAYFLAMKAINQYPVFKRLLQRRFRYVFVDEMQDMDKHQYDLLEAVFYDKGNSTSIYQRIGDNNQAIFSGIVKLENFWKSDDRTVLNIDGSCRFSKEIADVVQCFALEKQNIEGKSLHRSIKPHLLIYKDDTIKNVLPKFVDIVRNKQNSGEIPNGAHISLKAIGWRKSMDDTTKIAIKDYYLDFNINTQRTKVDYLNLKGYILKSKKNDLGRKSLGPIRKNILNAFLKMLRYEGIMTDSDVRYYTERRLFHFLKEEHNDIYLEFKLKLFLWCRDIYRGNTDKIFGEMKQYLPDMLHNTFGKNGISQKTKDFVKEDISNSADELQEQMRGSDINNVYRYNELEVEVGTIHSIKGETHSATLYLETFYCGDYESNRLKEYFKGNRSTGNEGVRVKESLKMAYVGMSRPTHLLCVAVHENRVKDYLNEIPDSLWEKVEI